MKFKPQPATKSSYSAGGQCVEVEITDDSVLVRNTTHPGTNVLRFSHGEWGAFVLGAQNGQFGFDQLT